MRYNGWLGTCGREVKWWQAAEGIVICGWLLHLNTAVHLESCRQLCQQYPEWKLEDTSFNGRSENQTQSHWWDSSSLGHSSSGQVKQLSRSRSRSPLHRREKSPAEAVGNPKNDPQPAALSALVEKSVSQAMSMLQTGGTGAAGLAVLPSLQLDSAALSLGLVSMMQLVATQVVQTVLSSQETASEQAKLNTTPLTPQPSTSASGSTFKTEAAAKIVPPPAAWLRKQDVGDTKGNRPPLQSAPLPMTTTTPEPKPSMKGEQTPSSSSSLDRQASRALLLQSRSSRISALEAEFSEERGTRSGQPQVPQPALWTPEVESLPSPMQDAAGPADVAGPGSKRRVLICGHSYVFWAERQARKGALGAHLGLSAAALVEWRGRKGLRWEKLLPLLLTSRKGLPPDLLVLHLGGNDLGLLTGRGLSLQMVADIHAIQEAWPQTVMAWSAMIPRQKWPGDARRLDGARKRVNRTILTALRNGLGFVIPHPDINHLRTDFYREDGVGLTVAGTHQFLCDLQKGIRAFLEGSVEDRDEAGACP
nr:PREDICTED: uncharacterized protein LOC103281487 isoform X3 [Anolis carolinensis]|eukprot:XP_008121350.1 PREDICTED: uncharacterized protein LOC103281487 isoform X3 [Anolis carolinensis]